MLGVVQLAGFVCILCSRPAVLGLNFKGNALLSLKNIPYVPCKGFSIAVIGQPVIRLASVIFLKWLGLVAMLFKYSLAA